MCGGGAVMAYKIKRNNTWGKWNVPVTKEGLISCIEEFVRMKEERA